MIKSENDITGAWARQRREELGLSQTEFWRAACLSKAMASAYENGREMSPRVRRLMYLRHVLGIPVEGDLSSLHGIAERLRNVANVSRQVGDNIEDAIAVLESGETR